MEVLRITHNAGFFSCCCQRFLHIVNYYNTYGILPPKVDSSEQLEWYKSNPKQDLWSEIFNTEFERAHHEIMLPEKIQLTTETAELQFSNYKLINFKVTTRLIAKYFMPTFNQLQRQLQMFKNNIPENRDLCAVFYRGNDKNRETTIGSYQEFISKAKEIQKLDPNIQFVVQPDETEFLEAFKSEFPDAVHFQECEHMSKKDSCIMLEMPKEKRAEHAKNYLASVSIMAQSKYLITHSGNGGLFAVLFRGNSTNVHQFLNGKWL